MHTTWVRVTGLVVLLAATALAVWARIVLGTMWSAAPHGQAGASAPRYRQQVPQLIPGLLVIRNRLASR